MRSAQPWPALPAIALIAALAACTATPSHRPVIRHPPPPGFKISRNTRLPPPPAVLAVAPATNLLPRTLHLGPFPRPQLPSLIRAIVNQPVRTIARPLLLSGALHPGGKVTMVAGDLPSSPRHATLFILQGPASRAQRLVAVSHGVAAGIVTLPTSMQHGTWILAAEDFSQIHVSGPARPTGTILLDIAVFTVP